MELLNQLHRYREIFEKELVCNILDFWNNHIVDSRNGGFYGALDRKGNPDLASPKGCVLNTRIMPIIKRICTSSFVIVSGGWCLLALGFSYWLYKRRIFIKI